MASKYQVVVARFEDVDTTSDALRAVAKSIKLADWAVVLNKGGGDIAFREGKDAGGGRGFALGALATAAAAIMLGPVGWTGLAARAEPPAAWLPSSTTPISRASS